MEQRFSFEVEGPPRRIDDGGVERLDAALARAAGTAVDRLLHAIDPRRILAFTHGGPPVWSVALCPTADGAFHFVTYGLSRAIEPDARFDHEMSIRVSGDGGEPPSWPVFLLRQLARYQITSGRELRAGDPMDLCEPISRAAMAPAEKAAMPDTAMRAIAVVDDPVLPGARRVYGLLPDEHALAESWSTAGFVGEVARREPTLTVDLRRGSWCGDARLVQAVHDGTLREGSATPAMVVPGVGWERIDGGVRVRFPGGEAALRICARAKARLGFGRNLLLHDTEPRPFGEVGLVPTDKQFVRAHGDELLELGVPSDSRLLWLLEAQATRDPSVPWIYFKLQ